MVLTELGKGVLRSADDGYEHSSPDHLVADVALHPEDPLLYTALTRRFAKAGAGLLVDPYFKADHLPWLVETTLLRRVMVTDKQKPADLSSLRVALATVPGANEVEIRVGDGKQIHDRCLIEETRQVVLLGASMTGIGKHLTALFAPGPPIQQAYRDTYERLWQSAETLAPQHPITPPRSPETGLSRAQTGQTLAE
ncbi:hypothetical protein [Actinacidiphila oryziradicis]|uniref:Uncharacterized protein n=1 Tax=Actinacidiphila oryziradicis TaxID=2571141 RepID=A0A4V5MXJ9_9ACTN|nr:hypothetical protein [Actinacidiphila oryziradicis]TKA00499.1 hypothetical protein FCI23_42650 [Actinacidiphila oryziradicis]